MDIHISAGITQVVHLLKQINGHWCTDMGIHITATTSQAQHIISSLSKSTNHKLHINGTPNQLACLFRFDTSDNFNKEFETPLIDESLDDYLTRNDILWRNGKIPTKLADMDEQFLNWLQGMSEFGIIPVYVYNYILNVVNGSQSTILHKFLQAVNQLVIAYISCNDIDYQNALDVFYTFPVL